MIIDDEFHKKVAAILSQDQRYPDDAYEFVNDVVAFTVKKRAESNPAGRRHVSGGELLECFRELGIARFGPLVHEVMAQWGIKAGLDVGNIVFNMIEHKLLRKSEEDSIDDFKNSYDFEEAFLAPFRPSAKPSPLQHIIA